MKKQELFLTNDEGVVTGVLLDLKSYQAILRKLGRSKDVRELQKAKRAILNRAAEDRTTPEMS